MWAVPKKWAPTMRSAARVFCADEGDVDGRWCCWTEDAVRAAGLLQVRKDALLQAHVLQHRLHNLAWAGAC